MCSISSRSPQFVSGQTCCSSNDFKLERVPIIRIIRLTRYTFCDNSVEIRTTAIGYKFDATIHVGWNWFNICPFDCSRIVLPPDGTRISQSLNRIWMNDIWLHTKLRLAIWHFVSLQYWGALTFSADDRHIVRWVLPYLLDRWTKLKRKKN